MWPVLTQEIDIVRISPGGIPMMPVYFLRLVTPLISGNIGTLDIRVLRHTYCQVVKDLSTLYIEWKDFI